MPPLILADLGGVVVKIDPERCHRCWSQLSTLSLTEVAERLFPDEVYEALERGQSTEQEYLANVRQVLSFELGARKPEAACFQAVLEAEGVPPDDVILIEDVQGHVAAAHAPGLVGLHFTTVEQLCNRLEQLDV